MRQQLATVHRDETTQADGDSAERTAERFKRHSLNEASCPAPEALIGQILRSEPKDAAAIARELPEVNRARLAAFCYGRKHLNHLGLLIASTCEMPMLRRAFGTAANVVHAQSRDVEATLAQAERPGSSKSVTLATGANVVPLRRR